MGKYYQCECGVVINMAEAIKDGKKCPSCGKDAVLKTDATELPWKSNMVEWGTIYHPALKKEVMTYYMKGRPAYDTVTALFVDTDGELYYYKFDQDEGCWDDGSCYLCTFEEYENAKEVGFY